jgi:hypothetical protein
MTSGKAGGLPFAGPSKGSDRKRKRKEYLASTHYYIYGYPSRGWRL